MRHDDPDVGQFSALLDDLAALREGRRFAKSMATPKPTRHEFVPASYFTKAQRIADERAARASIGRTTADLAALERQVRTTAAERATENAGERRARIRAAVQDVLDRAMHGLATGQVTAVQVSRIEAQAHRLLARVEPGIAMQRGVAA